MCRSAPQSSAACLTSTEPAVKAAVCLADSRQGVLGSLLLSGQDTSASTHPVWLERMLVVPLCVAQHTDILTLQVSFVLFRVIDLWQ